MNRVGLPELVIILLIVLVLFGASRIPGIMRSLGRGLREFKNAVGGKPEKKPARRRNGE